MALISLQKGYEFHFKPAELVFSAGIQVKLSKKHLNGSGDQWGGLDTDLRVMIL